MTQTKSPLKIAIAPVRALFVSDAREGLLLMAVAVLALIVANSAFSRPYEGLLHGTLPWSPVPKLSNVHLWINDGLMALFFFVVGLEVKREIVDGDLADRQARRLPVMAAVAGMIVPAAVFISVVSGNPELDRGWAIPAATDIAFAMGVVGLLGNRVPAALRLFLLTVAIVDDIGAVIVIAVFYTAKVKAAWAIGAVAAASILALFNMRRIDSIWPYAIVAVALWFCVLHSGIHATVAGVVAALCIPMRKRDDTPLLAPLEHRLTPWNAYFVVPLFALANAGVDLRGANLDTFLAPLPLAVAAGLVIGKQAGIMGAIFAATKLGIAQRPRGTSWLQVWGVSVLCGIGFTMSLFIGTMAFAGVPELYEQAKIGVLTGTFISLVMGYLILRFARPVAASSEIPN